MNRFNEERDAELRRKTKIVVKAIVAALVLLLSVPVCISLFEQVDADEIVVIQSPVSGDLNWYTSPGVKWQGMGSVTRYLKRDQFWFSEKADQGKETDDSLSVRFNDGAHAKISGAISWEMPIDDISLTALHTKFGSHIAIQQQLVRTIVEKSVYMTGPLMSSKESYAERRNDLLNLIEDQIVNGVYQTRTVEKKVQDPMTGQEKTVNKVELVLDTKGILKRQEESALKQFKIKTFNLTINNVVYPPEIENQIKQQQQALMQVQIAVAQAKQAEQQAITAAKEGEAKAAKSKWEQEVIKAKVVTEAEQKKAVAELDVQTADLRKKEAILLGEGEAEKRKLIMSADGALEKKLATYERVNEMYAGAIAQYQGDWVPSVVMGGQSVQGNGANTLIDLLTAQTAKDLALDMSVPGNK
jgi:regulator of protease activity HflC (stomatin/prohibitin superfamily)